MGRVSKRIIDEDQIKQIRDEYKDKYYGDQKIYHKLKDEGIRYKDINKALENDPIREAYKPYNKSKSSFITDKPFQQWQIDLLFITSRDRDVPILVCIDVFSKYVAVEWLLDKSEKNVIEAMKRIFTKMKGVPESIYCDEGSEFINKGFRRLMTEKGINILYTRSHAVFVERVIGTIKTMLFKHLHDKGFNRLSKDLLQKVVDDYNDSYHSTIKMTPDEAHFYKQNRDEVKKNIIMKAKLGIRKNKHVFKEGDKVRFLKNTGTFRRGYEPLYTKSIYTIEKIDGEYVHLKGKDKPVLIGNIKPAVEVEVADSKVEDTDSKVEVEEKPDEDEYEQIKKEKRTRQYLKKRDIDKQNIIKKRTRAQLKLDNLRTRMKRDIGLDLPEIRIK